MVSVINAANTIHFMSRNTDLVLAVLLAEVAAEVRDGERDPTAVS